jgi:hypothetical protein
MSRIVKLFAPDINNYAELKKYSKKQNVVIMMLPDTGVTYELRIGESMPSFTLFS